MIYLSVQAHLKSSQSTDGLTAWSTGLTAWSTGLTAWSTGLTAWSTGLELSQPSKGNMDRPSDLVRPGTATHSQNLPVIKCCRQYKF